MLNWAGHPQVQSQTQGDYSRFASRGLATLCLLAMMLWAGPGHAQDEPGSLISDETQAEAQTGEADSADSMDQATQDAGSVASDAAEQSSEQSSEQASPPATTAAASGSVELNDNVPLRYVVKKGDTLWDIAGHYLKQPWKWPELWYSNPDIKNPHLIYPGEVLYLTYVDGKPRLSRDPPPSTTTSGGVEKLSPRVRVEDLEQPIPTIPGDAIRNFLRGARVVGATELDGAPYLVEFIGEHLIGGANISAYAKGIGNNPAPAYTLVRKGGIYRDPESKEILGYEAAYIGTASILTPGETARVRIDTSVREVLIGDRLLQQDESDVAAAAYYPHTPEADIRGHIIAVTDGVSQIGQYQIVTLSRGKRDGVEVGQVFSIYQAGRSVRDPYGSSANSTVALPEERAGLMMVFRTFERVSYALVMKATRSIHLLDTFSKPQD